MTSTTRIHLVLLAATVVLATAAPAAAAAPSTRAGDAVVVSGSGDELRSGDATTAFSLRLPPRSACPGDSADGGYRVQSFVVPASSDPGVLRYKSLGPDVEGGYALYDTNTRTYAQAQTAKADPPAREGVIVNIPVFDFAVYPEGALSDGEYHVGIACTLENRTERYWDTRIVLRTTSSAGPARIRWALVGHARPAERDRSPARLVLPAVVLVLGCSIAAIRWRSRQQQTTSTLEDR